MKKTKDPPLNPCKCGLAKQRVSDWGEFAAVRCRGCGQDTGFCANTPAAAARWNELNPLGVRSEKPRAVECNGVEFLDWCRRAEAGEVRLAIITPQPHGYRLTLHWRE